VHADAAASESRNLQGHPQSTGESATAELSINFIFIAASRVNNSSADNSIGRCARRTAKEALRASFSDTSRSIGIPGSFDVR
jgi:hypothetical protein